jgi:hypothetical protein
VVFEEEKKGCGMKYLLGIRKTFWRCIIMNSWERQRNETAKAYHGFEVYRDLGLERSLQKASKKLAKNRFSLARLSKKYRWVERTRDYDAFITREKVKAMKNEIIDMGKRQAQESKDLQDIAYRIVLDAHALLRSPAPDDRVIGPALRFAERYLQNYSALVNIEREAMGYAKEQLESSLIDAKTAKSEQDSQKPVKRPTLDILPKIGQSKDDPSARQNAVRIKESKEGKNVQKLNRRTQCS